MARRGGDFFDNIEPLFGRQVRPNFENFRIGRGTRRLLVIGFIVLVFLFVISPLVGLYLDRLWFSSLGFGNIFQTRLSYQVVLGVIGFLVAFLVLAINAVLALRLIGPSQLSKIGVRRRVLSTAAGRLALAGAAIAGLVFGRVALESWQTVAKGLNATAFGQSDPQFGMDIGFYIFQYPMLTLVWGWLVGLVVVSLLVVGGIYLSRAGGTPATITLPPGAVGHVSILGSALFLLLAAHYRLAMYGLLVRKGQSVVFGAGYTDQHVLLPVYWVLLVAMLVIAVLLLVNIFLGRVWIPIAALVLWLVAVLLLVGIVPGVYQGLFVRPAELQQEKPNIQREIDATNDAFGLSAVEFKDFTDKQQIAPPVLAANSGTVNNLRLWDYQPLQTTYNQIQTIRQYYDFNDVDIDRYTLPDGYHQVMISARELSPDRLPDSAKTWVNLHLVYTHGYGAAATPVNQVAGEGLPNLVLRDIPPAGVIPLSRPQLYFGETSSGYVVVDSKAQEVDYEKQDTQQYTRWEGRNGIPMTALHRAAFAYQLGDVNLILSNQISGESQILYRRDVRTRLQTLAPFLTFDKDPYVVVSNGKLYWIEDAYTTAGKYPYSDSTGGINYMRNSVKVMMDAYDGSVTMYTADDKDPVLRTYSKIFPGTFHPLSEMPTDVRTHIRYPVDLFAIQAERLQNYHMHDAQAFYSRSDSWSQPQEIKVQAGQSQPLQPYYVVMRLPGQDHEEFVLIQPFTPLNKKNMVAWIAARSDGNDYGKLLTFRYPTDRQVPGPEQVESRIDQDTVISPQLTLLNQSGSKVIRGNLLVIPIGDGTLFVEPVYVASQSNAIPELKKVVVADEQRVVWADSLGQALDLLTSGAGNAPTATPSPGQQQPAAPSQVELIKKANDLYNDAQNKLKNGDLKGYADDIQQIGDVLKQLQSGGGTAPGSSPASSPRP
jgi:uncharacterized membrane protein (UPF0182 family)